MKLLAIETSTLKFGVALIDGERLLSSYEVLAGYVHAIELPAAVTRVLGAAHLTLKELDGLVIDIGPGSFTGLRVGLAFVKALAFTHRGLAVVGVPSLDVLAAHVRGQASGSSVCPILDAKQKKVYTAIYQPTVDGVKRTSDPRLCSIDEAITPLREPVVVLGDGCQVYRQQLLDRFGAGVQVAPQEFWWPHAATLARLGHERLTQGQRDDPAQLLPLYLHPHDCGVNPAVKTPRPR